MAPINDAFVRDWPQAVRMNLLDDSLSPELGSGGKALDEAVVHILDEHDRCFRFRDR